MFCHVFITQAKDVDHWVAGWPHDSLEDHLMSFKIFTKKEQPSKGSNPK